MGRLLESLKRHYAETPQEVLDKEREERAYLNEIGPDVFEYAEEMKEYIEFMKSCTPTIVYKEQKHAYSFDSSNDAGIHNESNYDHAA